MAKKIVLLGPIGTGKTSIIDVWRNPHRLFDDNKPPTGRWNRYNLSIGAQTVDVWDFGGEMTGEAVKSLHALDLKSLGEEKAVALILVTDLYGSRNQDGNLVCDQDRVKQNINRFASIDFEINLFPAIARHYLQAVILFINKVDRCVFSVDYAEQEIKNRYRKILEMMPAWAQQRCRIIIGSTKYGTGMPQLLQYLSTTLCLEGNDK